MELVILVVLVALEELIINSWKLLVVVQLENVAVAMEIAQGTVQEGVKEAALEAVEVLVILDAVLVQAPVKNGLLIVVLPAQAIVIVYVQEVAEVHVALDLSLDVVLAVQVVLVDVLHHALHAPMDAAPDAQGHAIILVVQIVIPLVRQIVIANAIQAAPILVRPDAVVTAQALLAI